MSRFDEVIDRRGTHCAKWDMMETTYGVPATDGIAMWIADMDFRPPAAATEALEAMIRHGVYGYYGDEASNRDAICWWMQERHGWTVDPDWILTAHGLVNGVAVCIDALTAPGDGVVLLTPVYHAFARLLQDAGRRTVSCPLAVQNGAYTFDFTAWDAQLDGTETLAILCSPQNPGGRVWSADELRGVADFCRRHDLILAADEIHHDLVYPPHRHIPMPLAAPEIEDRLIVLTAASKTFNLAGMHTGNLIVADSHLRQRLQRRMRALGISPNSFGMVMAEAVYAPAGAAWLDELLPYLDRNRRLLDAGLATLPGVVSMPLEATYLAWIDFRGTGLDDADIHHRMASEARIAANHGITFGPGGEGFLRLNFATPRPRIEEAIRRLQVTFGA